MTGLQRGRTAVFALLATVLALLAHVAGGGAAPGPGAVGLVVLATATAGSWLASRRPGAVRAVLVLGAVQVLAHTAFAAASPMPMPHGGHARAMALAHAAAVAVTGWLLARGEQAVEALLARVLPALPGPVRVVPAGPTPRATAPAPDLPPLGAAVVGHLTFRGPPGSRAVVL